MDEMSDDEWPQNDYKDDDDEGSNEYDNGSMVYGTMIMADQDGGDGGGDEEEYDQYGTMIMAEDDIKSNGYSNGGGYDDNQDQNEDEDEYGGYGTVIMSNHQNEEQNVMKTEMHANDLVSIFDGQHLINSVITLPDNPTKQELLNINETLKQLFSHDLQKLQDYYQANIAFIQKRINKMD